MRSNSGRKKINPERQSLSTQVCTSILTDDFCFLDDGYHITGGEPELVGHHEQLEGILVDPHRGLVLLHHLAPHTHTRLTLALATSLLQVHRVRGGIGSHCVSITNWWLSEPGLEWRGGGEPCPSPSSHCSPGSPRSGGGGASLKKQSKFTHSLPAGLILSYVQQQHKATAFFRYWAKYHKWPFSEIEAALFPNFQPSQIFDLQCSQIFNLSVPRF